MPGGSATEGAHSAGLTDCCRFCYSRRTNKVQAEVTESPDKETLQSFKIENTSLDSIVYTDEAHTYRGLPRAH